MEFVFLSHTYLLLCWADSFLLIGVLIWLPSFPFINIAHVVE